MDRRVAPDRQIVTLLDGNVHPGIYAPMARARSSLLSQAALPGCVQGELHVSRLVHAARSSEQVGYNQEVRMAFDWLCSAETIEWQNYLICIGSRLSAIKSLAI